MRIGTATPKRACVRAPSACSRSRSRRERRSQEYITPYTPEHNGMIERFFPTLKQECVWLHRFASRDEAFRIVADWLDRYDTDRPHSALGYLTSKAYREKLAA